LNKYFFPREKMIAIRKILLAADLTSNGIKASKYARYMAEKFGAELHALHVLESVPTSTPTFAGGLALTSFVPESAAAAEAAIQELLDPDHHFGNRLIPVTVDGTPATQILRYTEEADIDLIIMGTHGRTGLAHIVMGSVAEHVLRHAARPVLTVPSRD
jgi:universal stress protein A